MKIKWRKIEPRRVQLVHETELGYYDENGEKKYILVNKDNPVEGIVTMVGDRKIGNNDVEFYYFIPDFYRGEGGYTISKKWFKKLPSEKAKEE